MNDSNITQNTPSEEKKNPPKQQDSFLFWDFKFCLVYSAQILLQL